MLRTKNIILLAVILLVIPSNLYALDAAVKAPFGLKWGMSLEEIKPLIGKITLNKVAGRLRTVLTTNVKDAYASTKVAYLIFDAKYGLIRVDWLSRYIIKDNDGSIGKKIIQIIKKDIESKHGKATHSAYSINEKVRKKRGFYACIGDRANNCGNWSDSWYQKGKDTDFGSILLSINANKNNDGYILVTYNSPDWQKAASASALGW